MTNRKKSRKRRSASQSAGDRRIDSPPSSTHLNLLELEPRILYSAAPLAELDGLEATQATSSELIHADSDGAAAEPAVSDILIQSAQFSESSEETASDFFELELAYERVELIVVDSSVDNYKQLLNGIDSSSETYFEVLILDEHENGIDQISETLAGMSGLSAIHVVSHGADGEFVLGNSRVNNQSLDGYAAQIATWQNALTDSADLLFYGCDLAASENGQTLLESFSALCDCDVAASEDLTGNESLGGDWDLEYTTGAIESDIAFSFDVQATWFGVLGSITVDTMSDVLDGDADTTSLANLVLNPGSDGFVSLREAIIAANTHIGADTINLGDGIFSLALVGAGEDFAATGDLDITDDLTIVGAGTGSTIVDGGGIDRIFHVHAGVVNVENMTIQNGLVTSGVTHGGGISVASGVELTIDRVEIKSNNVTGPSSNGGGIYNDGIITIIDSSITDNSATTGGGGLYNRGTATISSSLFAGNSAGGSGGGIFQLNTGSSTLTNVTISGNDSRRQWWRHLLRWNSDRHECYSHGQRIDRLLRRWDSQRWRIVQHL